jgi:predicted peptidase
VDQDRIYTTGTSMGAMASMVMMEKDPDLFAATYPAAGQRADPEAVKDIWDKNIFFLTSEDDPSYERAATNVAVWERVAQRSPGRRSM